MCRLFQVSTKVCISYRYIPNFKRFGGWFIKHSTKIDPQLNLKPTFPTGAVTGGVFGGVIFLILLCLSIYFWKRRRPQVTSTAQHETYTGEAAYHAVNPYLSSLSPPPYSTTILTVSNPTPVIGRKRPAFTIQTSNPAQTHTSVCAFAEMSFVVLNIVAVIVKLHH